MHTEIILSKKSSCFGFKRLDNEQGRRNEKRARGADFVEGHRQNFNYVKIHTLEFRGSVAFFLRQILTDHILSIASAITLDIREI